jgi:hypothetical protein
VPGRETAVARRTSRETMRLLRSRAMKRAFLASVIILAACGGPAASSGAERIGISGRAPAAPGAVELALRRADGSFIDVGDLRGHVVVLFVFATYDAISQLAIHPLRAIAERYPNVRIVGIAAEPSARLLIGPYEHALHPPFPVTYDPEELVHSGEGPLGELEAVPTVIVLDREGVPAGRHVGLADERRLQELLRGAGVRDGRP